MKISSINLSHKYGRWGELRRVSRSNLPRNKLGRSHTRAHSRAVFLKIVFGIKCEVTHGKDYSNEVANSFRRDMFISAFLKEKTTVT